MKLELTALNWRKTDTGSGVTIRLEAIGADAPTPGAKTAWPREPGKLRIANWKPAPLLIAGRFRKSVDNTGPNPSESWEFVPDDMDDPTFIELSGKRRHYLEVTFEAAQRSLMKEGTM